MRTLDAVILSELAVDAGAFETRTGWKLKPEGACKGDICVPMPDAVRRADGRLDAQVLADRLGMPLVSDEAHGVWALGPATTGSGRVIRSCCRT